MSSFPPPSPYFNGIIYDNSFFNVFSSSGLTLSQANAKFLQKTTPDIATALETFSGGIKTNLISIYTGTVLTLGAIANTVNIYSPTLASPNPTDTDSSTKISSTSWVGSWFNYKRLNEDIDWVVAQSFRAGIKTNKITFYTGSTVTIGTVDSTATNLYSPKLLSTVPSNTDNSTNIISSAWVNTFWNYVRTQAYSWSGIQTFNSGIKTNLISYPGSLTMGSVTNLVNIYSPTLASDVPVDTDDSSNIPSTAWVNTFWTYVRTQAYSWSGIQTFNSGIIATSLNGVSNEDGSIDLSGWIMRNVLFQDMTKIGNNFKLYGYDLTPTINAIDFYPAVNTPIGLFLGFYNIQVTFQLTGTITDAGIMAFGVTTDSASGSWLYDTNGNFVNNIIKTQIPSVASLPLVYTINFNTVYSGYLYFKYYIQASSFTGSLVMNYSITKIG